MKIEKTEYNDWIENFLDGKLTDEGNKQFMDMLKTNPELEQQYQFRIKMAEDWTKAKEYDETRKLFAGIDQEVKSEKKNKLVVMSIAASLLLLISVSGVLMYSNRNNEQTTIAKNQKGTETTVVPQIKYAEEKASIHFNGELRIIAPVKNKNYSKNDSIVFTWNSQIDAETNIVIVNQKSGKTIFREKIKINSQKFILEKNFLPEGDYLWYIEGFPGKEKFKVVSEKPN
jgi:hypothetical protein